MSEAVLECREVTKKFGGMRAVDNVSAAFEAGRVTALVGPNGAGKTTLFHLIAGALKLDTGDVFLQGSSISGLPSWRVARLGVGRLFQDLRLFDRLSVLENVMAALSDSRDERPSAALLARARVRARELEHQKTARRLLDLVDLSDYSSERAASLSYGQQKLLAIARLFAPRFKVFLVDEPTAGLHPLLVDRVLTLIRGLADSGKTIILIEHNMNVVLEIADWVYFMDQGQVAAFGLPGEVLADAEVRSLYLGL